MYLKYKGQALLRYGEAHSKLSENQSDFVIFYTLFILLIIIK